MFTYNSRESNNCKPFVSESNNHIDINQLQNIYSFNIVITYIFLGLAISTLVPLSITKRHVFIQMDPCSFENSYKN